MLLCLKLCLDTAREFPRDGRSVPYNPIGSKPTQPRRMTMTTKDSASANGNGSIEAAQAPAIDTDTLREIAAAESATKTGGTDTGTAPMSAVPEPVVLQPTMTPPPREPGLDEPAHHADRETIPDHPDYVPGTTNPRTTRRIVYGVMAAAVVAALLIFGRLFTGSAAETEQVKAPAVPTAGQPAPAPAAAIVPKDADATECATMGVSTDTFRDGWCKGRAPGAYLLADDTMAYCSCAKPRKMASSGK